MPHKFEAHPDHPAVAYLVRLHADLGGRIQQNKAEGVKLATAMHGGAAALTASKETTLLNVGKKGKKERSGRKILMDEGLGPIFRIFPIFLKMRDAAEARSDVADCAGDNGRFHLPSRLNSVMA